jgi:hypothetical protein
MSAGPWRVKRQPPSAVAREPGASDALPPDERLLTSIRARRLPLVVVTGPSDHARWGHSLSDLDVRAVHVRPVFIGEVTRAAGAALRTDG